VTNPLDAFKGLKKWQQGAVAIGGVVVVGGFVLYERKAKASAAAAAATPTATAGATSATVGDMVTDPTTGETYPAESVDPATGLTYATELQEYGSVAAADEQGAAAGDAAIEEGLTQTQYDEETGQSPGSGSSATNEQWVTEVESALEQLGYSDTDIQQGLARYFSSSPQGTAADGTNLYQMMDTAIGEFGPPPSGTYALIKGGATAPGPGASSVEVPNEIGREDLATAEAAIKAAGLVPHPAGDSAVGNKGKVTAQNPAAGSMVSKGSSVTLTYTVTAAAAPPKTGAGDVTVPNEVGRTDLNTAETAIKLAGLVPKAAGDSPVGNKGRVTAQNPKAGAKVAKGSTVTLTYTVAPSKTNVHV
jgi:hypothetical protein